MAKKPAAAKPPKAKAEKRPPGRASLYTPALAQEIADRLSTGEPLAHICRDAHMPHPSTVRAWQDADNAFALVIARAREDGFDAIALECLAIANTPLEGVETTRRGRQVETKRSDMLGHRKLQIETRLKLLAKWDPKRYGEQTKVEHSGMIGLEHWVLDSLPKPTPEDA